MTNDTIIGNKRVEQLYSRAMDSLLKFGHWVYQHSGLAVVVSILALLWPFYQITERVRERKFQKMAAVLFTYCQQVAEMSSTHSNMWVSTEALAEVLRKAGYNPRALMTLLQRMEQMGLARRSRTGSWWIGGEWPARRK